MFSKRLVDPEIIDWQLDGFAWLIDNFENVPGLPETELWLPIPKHYPDAKGRVLADHIFDCVKRQCRFSDEDIFELIAMEGRPDFDLGGLAMIQTEGDTACGTYQFIPKAYGGPKEIIRYDAGLGDNPAQLVATFAHELGHALHMRATEELDEPPELYELFTDLTAVFLGFGVFLSNARFEFSQFSDGGRQGWQMSGAGYLPEADLIFATALFMAIKNISETVPKPFLKPRLQKMLSKAFKQLSKFESEIADLRNRIPPKRSKT